MALFTGVVLLFAATLYVVWLLLFPAASDPVRRFLGSLGAGMRRRAGGAGSRSAGRVRLVGHGMLALLIDTGGMLGRQWPLLLLVLAMVLAPPVLILAVRTTVDLHPFPEEDVGTSASMIARLLRGERLVPPMALPEATFMTDQVRAHRPDIVTADRRWNRIDPDLQQRVLAIYRIMQEQGYDMVIVEGYRNPQRQNELMAKGAATRAEAWQSCHQYGLAVDSALLRDGTLQWDIDDPWTRNGYLLYGELAREAGLEWGGDWRRIKDYVHVEMGARCAVQKAARRAGSAGEPT